jgi:putative spermidine/putrescine transport system permease protein
LRLADSYTALIHRHAPLGALFVLARLLAALQGFNYNLVRASLSPGACDGHFLPNYSFGDCSGCDRRCLVSLRDVVRRGHFFLAGLDPLTLPRRTFTSIREKITTLVAVATLLVIFITSLLLVLEWLRGTRA